METTVVCPAGTRRSDDRGEGRHGDDRADAEREDVSDRCASGWKRERGEHAEEVRASRHSMQDAEVERGVRMAEPTRPWRPCLNEQVLMQQWPVSVACRPNACASPQRPESNADESGADDAFAPRREDVDGRQRVAKQHRKYRDHNHAGRMPDAPRPSREPSAAAVFERERSDGRQMIWARQNVEKAGERAGQECQHEKMIPEESDKQESACWKESNTIPS